jgi:hypothetical protein
MDLFRAAWALATVFGLLGLLCFLSKQAKTTNRLRAGAIRAIWPQAMRARRAQNEAASLKILRRLNLTGTHQLHLISAMEGTFLVCTHPHGCTLLRANDAGSAAQMGGAAAEPTQRHAS